MGIWVSLFHDLTLSATLPLRLCYYGQLNQRSSLLKKRGLMVPYYFIHPYCEGFTREISRNNLTKLKC